MQSRRPSAMKSTPTKTLFLFGEENQEPLGEYLFYSDPDSEGEYEPDTPVVRSTIASPPSYEVDDEYDMTAAMGSKKKAAHLSINVGIKDTSAHSPMSPISPNRLTADPEKGDNLKKSDNRSRPPLPRRPWFLWAMTSLQIIGMGLSFFFAWQNTGSPIQTDPFNYLIGPPPGTLVQMGSVFGSCMKTVEVNGTKLVGNTTIFCLDGTNIPFRNDTFGTSLCTLQELCGFNEFGNEPNQFYRFFIAILLHGGIVHLGSNLLMQIRLGYALERSIGTWRMAVIYIIAGVGGFVFSGSFSMGAVSVGCSGSLYGIYHS
jgi:membrane associated rhomboid family serine protease